MSDAKRYLYCEIYESQHCNGPLQDEHFVLASDYDALQAEVERLNVDAARYRHLYRTHFGRFFTWSGDDYCIRDDEQAAIDKAMDEEARRSTADGERQS